MNNLSPVVEGALFFAILAALVATRVLDLRRFAFLVGFLVPINTPRLSIGVGLDWYKVIGPIVLLLMVGRKVRASRAAAEMRWLVVYCVVVSTIWMVLEYSILKRYRTAEAFGLEVTTTYYKMPVQLVSFVGQLLTAFAIPKLASTEAEVASAIRGFRVGALTSVSVGLLLWAVTGDGMVVSRNVFVEAEGVRLSRLGGLSGEPKTLGAILVILCIYEVCVYTFSRGRHGKPSPPVLLFGLAGLALTFATSAWSAMLVGLVIALGMGVFLGRWRQVAILGAALTVGGALILANPFGKSMYTARFEQRLFGERSEVGRQKDSYVFEAFRENPRDLVWGYGLGGGDLEVIRFIPPGERWYRRPPTPGVTGVRILGDLGLAGLVLFGSAVALWTRRLMRAGDRAGGAFVFAGFVAAMFMSMNGLSAYLLLAGAILARSALRDRSDSPPEPSSVAAMEPLRHAHR